MLCKIILIVLIVFDSSLLPAQAQSKDVSNTEIRDAILSLVHSYTLLDNKLERHEQRERALGELVKKGLLTLQKNQRIFDPLKGLIQRLDDRVAQIETKMMDQEEKIKDVLTDILSFMKDSRSCNSQQNDNSDENGESDGLGKKLDHLTEDLKGLRIQVGELRAERVLAENNIIDTLQHKDSAHEATNPFVDQVISKLEDKLSNFYITVSNQNNNNGLSLNGNSTDFAEIVKSSLDRIEAAVTLLPDKSYIQNGINETIESILDTRLEVLTASDKALSKTGNRIKEAFTNVESLLNEILKNSLAISTASEKHQHDIESLRGEVSNLSSIEKIFVQTGDNILDLKRRVEYGIHQILLEVNDIVKENTNTLNSSIGQRIDGLDGTIMSNISVKIETEISQVWRQIGIMYQEISSSKQSLDKLQQQTELYVNGTVTTMESMQGKMSLVTGRMSEVDENLNYLLGRLSLVTQEFGQIKTGLSSALESIRNSFKAVQDQIKVADAGPGPHNITDY